MKFYNRESEFNTLGKLKGDFRVAVIGRRRIGKTTLVETFYKGNCLNLFVSAEKAEREIVAGWVKEYNELHLPNVSTFYDLFDFIFSNLRERVVFIDEMQNILKVNKSFLSDLQRLIDKYKPKLVVSGSIISVMKNIIEEYKSPLYGRFDFIIKLEEFRFKTVFEICRDLGLGIEEAIRIYSVFGGIPKYYELIEKIKQFDFDELILNSFVSYPRPLFEEVKTMLKEEFGSEYKTFFSILSSIAQGNNRASEIAGFLGKKQTEITKYLALLRDDFEIIERKTPLLVGSKGLYSIRSNVVRYWFNNIWRYNELLEGLQEERLREIVRESLNRHVAKSFEGVIMELSKSLFPRFDAFGQQWGNFHGEKGKDSYEIDLAASGKKELLFGECKWQEKVNALTIAKELTKKAQFIEDTRTRVMAVFAKSFSKRIDEYEGCKVVCFDLKDLEHFLKPAIKG